MSAGVSNHLWRASPTPGVCRYWRDSDEKQTWTCPPRASSPGGSGSNHWLVINIESYHWEYQRNARASSECLCHSDTEGECLAPGKHPNVLSENDAFWVAIDENPLAALGACSFSGTDRWIGRGVGGSVPCGFSDRRMCGSGDIGLYR